MRRAVVLMLFCAACSAGSREATLVEDFFAAARLQDTAALSTISRATFNPRTEGTVQRFTVRRIGDTRQEAGAPLEDVTVDAQVRTPEGRVETRALVFTLEKSVDGRWMIASVRRAGL
jgi:hypothetical protein